MNQIHHVWKNHFIYITSCLKSAGGGGLSLSVMASTLAFRKSFQRLLLYILEMPAPRTRPDNYPWNSQLSVPLPNECQVQWWTCGKYIYSVDPDFQDYRSNGINLTMNSRYVGKYKVTFKEYIFLFRLMKYVLYSFTRIFSTFHIGLLFTHTMALVNLLSRESITDNTT